MTVCSSSGFSPAQNVTFERGKTTVTEEISGVSPIGRTGTASGLLESANRSGFGQPGGRGTGDGRSGLQGRRVGLEFERGLTSSREGPAEDR